MISKKLNDESLAFYKSRLRQPSTDEVVKMRSHINQEVSCLTLWDNRLVINHDILKDVNEFQAYAGSVTMPFKGKNTGIVLILCGDKELYSIL